jgi:predicted kinase
MLFQFDNQTICRSYSPGSHNLVFVRGFPRSGKSTFCRKFVDNLPSYTIVCGDDFRMATHGQVYNRLAEPAVSQAVLVAIRALRYGWQQVIFDETNSSEWSLRRIFEIDPLAIYYDVGTEKKICIERNEATATRKIPPEVFDRIEHNLLTIDPEVIRKDYL